MVRRRVCAAAGVVAGACAFTVWNQSVVNEKVYTISLALFAIVTLLMLGWLDGEGRSRNDAKLVAIAFLLGAGYAVHPAGLLPGSLLRNAGLKYVCKPVELEVTNAQTRFTAAYGQRRTATMTVGNGEGNFFADEDTLDRLEGEGRVVFRYLDNPNGSSRRIAGIVNEGGNVLGLMPHPDRAFEPELGSADGALLFQSVAASA